MSTILVFGSANIDDVYSVEHIVTPGETISSLRYETFPGGKGLNQSVACRQAGASTYFAGKIGTDGQMLQQFLTATEVNLEHLVVGDTPTGRAIIQVDVDGRNSILLNDGANATIDEAMVDDVLSKFDPQTVLVLQNELNCTPYLLKQAAKKGMRIALNPSPINDRLVDCDLSAVTWLFINETEGFALTKQTDPQQILNQLHQRYPHLAILLTLGEEGCRYQDATQSLTVQAVPTHAVDTTGAGDTFTGYFLQQVLGGKSVPTSLATASMAASLAVSRKGAAIAIPTADEVQQALRNVKEK